MAHQYLSNYFTDEEAKDLFNRKGEIQLNTAPTGAGKTYFVMQNILEIAKDDFGKFRNICVTIANPRIFSP